jgi:hypothetical protein
LVPVPIGAIFGKGGIEIKEWHPTFKGERQPVLFEKVGVVGFIVVCLKSVAGVEAEQHNWSLSGVAVEGDWQSI